MSRVEHVESSKTADIGSLGKVPYTKDELEAIMDGMRRASWLIYGSARPCADLDESAWRQITHTLRAHGWPRRRWQQIRAKGRSLVSAARSAVGALSTTNPSSSGAQVLHPGAPCVAQSVPAVAPLYVASFHEGHIPRTKEFNITSFPLPTLLPAPSMQVNLVEPSSLNSSSSSCPKIASVCSTSEAGKSTQNCVPPSLPTSTPMFSQNLTQLLEEDYTPVFPVTPTNGSFGSIPDIPSSSNTLPVTLPFNSNLICGAPQPPPPPCVLDCMEREQRLRINTLKLEILALKRQFWLKKLKQL
ncbi:hypothetical protein X801_04895 [Opisthorchis viverrini]|uniref:Myb/SANT-like DNA-binding domain-containing protein n=1 Tax=Opisthorchis viverrini TaxID=6198 RepID=A0A1S8WXI9_OPIVI|nr:hypothetical protein X801_04895 [Opisthorchis viverrini]